MLGCVTFGQSDLLQLALPRIRLIEPVQQRQPPRRGSVRGKYENKYDKYMQNDGKVIKEFRKVRKYVIDSHGPSSRYLKGWVIGISTI